VLDRAPYQVLKYNRVMQ